MQTSDQKNGETPASSSKTSSLHGGAASPSINALTHSKPSFGQRLNLFRPRASTASPLVYSAAHSPAHGALDHSIASESVTRPLASSSLSQQRPGASAFVQITHSQTVTTSLPDAAPLSRSRYQRILAELAKPLPLTPASQEGAIAERAVMVRSLAGAVRWAHERREKNPPELSAAAASVPQETHAEPATSDMLKLCTVLMALEQPMPTRIAACDLLTASVQLADLHAATNAKSVSETRSGAPGSQSRGADQPLAGIDRALFYRLVCTLSHDIDTVAPAPSRNAFSDTALPALPAQLRALEVLSKEGRDIVGFSGIVPVLNDWMAQAWAEVQLLRTFAAELMQHSTAEHGLAESNQSEADESSEGLAKELSFREWSVQTGIQLLTSIFKFSFARIELSDVELALRGVSDLVLGTAASSRHAELAVLHNQAASRTSRRDRERGEGSSKRSVSKDAKPLTEGYSYYGLEAIASDVSNAASPSLGPTAIIPAPSEGAASRPAVAPIALITLPPSSRPVSDAGDDVQQDILDSRSLSPLLHTVDVRCICRLLDATLRYGYMPPACVECIIRMLCRALGYPVVARAVVDGGELGKNDWEEEVLPVLKNLLRSHCANSSIRAVRSLLAMPVEEQGQWESSEGQEDSATLVGSILFLRFAMAHISELKMGKQAQAEAAGSSGNGSKKDDALAPDLTLSLIMPALRGALKRESDLLDVEVLHLIADLLPSATKENQGSDRAGSSVAPSTKDRSSSISALDSKFLLTERLSLSDWNSILSLTVVARRHVEGWKLKGGAANPLKSSSERAPSDVTRKSKVANPMPSAVVAILQVLARVKLAPLPSLEHPNSLAGPQSEKTSSDVDLQSSLPWTPQFASLLVSLAPVLPDARVVELVQYYRALHLCLPSNEGWITNIRSLLQAFFHRSDESAKDFGASPAPRARRELVKLVFEHVYDAVRDIPSHRATLMRVVIIPLAQASLAHETDPEVQRAMREVLVEGTAASGARPPDMSDNETTEEDLGVTAGNEKSGADIDKAIFVDIRQLLIKIARGTERSLMTFHAPATSHSHAHVSFNVPAGSHDRPEPVDHGGGHTRQSSGSGMHNFGAVDPVRSSQAVDAVLDLIAIFNRMAFTLPWSMCFVERNDSAYVKRTRWEEHVRTSCIAVYRDLLSLLEPPEAPNTSAPALSLRARLAILQWFVRFRTDRQHRVYLATDLDYLINSSATTLLRGPPPLGPVGPQDGTGATSVLTSVAMETAASSDSRMTSGTKGTRGSTHTNRDDRRTGDASERSKSRTRDASGDSVGVERTRSLSRSRAPRRTEEQEMLWRLPEEILFEVPATSLRSDTVYTYIHPLTDGHDCCRGHNHLMAEDGKAPLPLPVSEFLKVAIRILTFEREWELVSYLICHLPHQLANKHLFCGPKAQDQVLVLRQLLCSTILKGSLIPNVILPDDIKKTDVYAVSYSILGVLISYRTLFSRPQQDEMVEAFIAGLNKSQGTALPSVRALSVACYELQKSVTRLLPGMLVKLSTVMSSTAMSVHILELIAAIGHMPACYANLTESDYKRVFGIALQYIQYHQSPAAARREDFNSSPASFSLSQYVMMLAYYCIALWFMSLRIVDRPKHVAYISRQLLLANEGREKLSDQTEVCFDFLARFTYSNADPKPKRSFLNTIVMGAGPSGCAGSTSKAPDKEKDRVVTKSWLIGKGLVTVTSLRKEGWAEILVRRASGTTGMLCKLENSPISTLPDEDGERIALPAVLMMDRDPDALASPIRTAPLLPPLHLDSRISPASARWSVRQHAEHRLRVGEVLRSRRPLGPAQYGLSRRPRHASFSGPLSGDVNSRAEAFGRYLQPEGKGVVAQIELPSGPEGEPADSESEEVQHLRRSSAAIREVMREVLEEPNSPRNVASVLPTASGGERAGPSFGQAENVLRRSGLEAYIDPGFIALQLSAYPDMTHDQAPIRLPDEPATDRMIRAVDLTPVVDFHKIGVLYVGPGQENEKEILGNRHGSPAYQRFLSGLGDLVRLRGQEDVYTGGLDRQTDEHGRYSYVWGDDITQIVYHTATLMPNRAEDAIHAAKKSLIGNDWTHIIFNESGGEYRFGTLPSQFNFVNIVVSANSRGGANLGSVAPDDMTFYRVSIQCRPGLPNFSPVGDGQLVSAEALPAFVRVLSLNANLMSQIYLDTGEAMQPYTSNWVSRLHHLTRFRAQMEAKRAAAADPSREQDGSADPDIHDFTRNF